MKKTFSHCSTIELHYTLSEVSRSFECALHKIIRVIDLIIPSEASSATMHVIIKHLSKSSEVPNLDYKTGNSLKFYRTLLNCSESEDKDSKNFASKFVENLSILGDKLQHGAFLASYGSTTVSLTFGEGTIEYVHITRSGYSSLIFDMRRVPMPAPVPPPRECVLWHVSSGFLVNCCKFYGVSSQKELQFEKYDTKFNRLLF